MKCTLMCDVAPPNGAASKRIFVPISLGSLRTMKRLRSLLCKALTFPVRTRPVAGAQFRKHSYAQCGEDLMIDFIMRTLGIDTPSYIDIGAHHPFLMSNTAIFYARGSRGINVEPALIEEFRRRRPMDVNLGIGISDQASVRDFYVMNVPTLNTFSRVDAEACEKQGACRIEKVLQLETDTIGNIVTQHAHGKCPEILSLDVEGLDLLVLKSVDFDNIRPIAICVETLKFATTGPGEKNTDIAPLLRDRGYATFADTYVNTIFVDCKKWRSR